MYVHIYMFIGLCLLLYMYASVYMCGQKVDIGCLPQFISTLLMSQVNLKLSHSASLASQLAPACLCVSSECWDCM